MHQRLVLTFLSVVLTACQQQTTPTSVVEAFVPASGITSSEHIAPLPTDAETLAALPPNTQTETESSETLSEAEMLDLWIRIRGGLSFDVPENDQVLAQREWYERNQEYMDRMAGRAALYLHHIVETIEARQLPMELALLPIVESAFQPYAYSRARASGLWQFIPGTGRSYGLKQNWWRDDRRNVVRSTDAALDYLTRLNNMFDGDWLLALAAYNSGEGNVARAIARNKKAHKPTDFWSLKLPKETRAYVPKLLALVQLLKEPERFALQWKNIPNTPYFARVKMDSQIDISLAAELAGISVDEIYQLNPSYSRWATDPEGEHELLLPIAAVDRFITGLEKVPQDDRVKWSHYKVRKGDTLGKIAKQFRTSTDQLRLSNKLKSDQLKLGQDILIPKSGSAENQPVSVVTYLSTREKNDMMNAHLRSAGKHKVRSGETLWSISRKYGVRLNDLLALNNLNKRSTVRVGQQLKLPTKG